VKRFPVCLTLFVVISGIVRISVLCQAGASMDTLVRDYAHGKVSLDTLMWRKNLVNHLSHYKPTDKEDTVAYSELLAELIGKFEQENKRLNSLLGALKFSPDVEKYFPQWYVEDANLQFSILRRLGLPEFIPSVLDSGTYRIHVVQAPVPSKIRKTADLLELQIVGKGGPVLGVGRGQMENSLGTSLYDSVKNGNYALQTSTAYLSQRRSNYGRFSASLLGAEALVHVDSADVGVKVDLGRELIGYPFYYGGTWNILAVYEPDQSQTYELGLTFPFHPGDVQQNLLGSLSFRQRRLNGAHGLIGRFEKQIASGGSLGAEFSIASMSEKGSNILIDSRGSLVESTHQDLLKTFYYLAGNLDLYYTADLSKTVLDGLQSSVGFGYYRVIGARLDSTDTHWNNTIDVERWNRFDVYARLSYDHQFGAQYGVALQYFDKSLLASAYLHIFHWFTVEGKYTRVVFRNELRPWEQRDLLALSPKLGFTFSF
jgi:hypothetical protein